MPRAEESWVPADSPSQRLPGIKTSSSQFQGDGRRAERASSPCTIYPAMREPGAVQRLAVPSRRPSARRKRRLVTGLARWDQDLQLSGEQPRRIATLTFTLPEGDPAAAVGRMYTFLRRVRQQWLGTRYFAWLELQARGAAHYHMVWVNPPVVPHKQMYAWVDRAWGGGRTQYRVHYQHGALQKELEYALSYAKKMGKKAYQQRYDTVPRELRTFMNQRLEFDGRALDEHRDQLIVKYNGGQLQRGVYVEGTIEILGVRVHVIPVAGYCSLREFRRTPYGKKERRKSGPGTPR